MANPEYDPLTGVKMTGHDFDGIKELRSPLPTWWVGVFLACVIFALGYAYVYPSWPSLNSAFQGAVFGGNRERVHEALLDAKAAQSGRIEQIAAREVADILADDDLRAYAQRGGEAAFNVNCIQCHGAGGAGQLGYFPVLADDDWIWGGAPDQIQATILYGVRSEHPDTRYSEMPRYGVDELLTPAEIESTAKYVKALSDPNARAQLEGTPGATVFAEQCSACHGADGEGVVDLGGPALNDFVWLYAGDGQGNADYDKLVAQISNPQQGVMPAWTGRIDDETIKMLSVYVHSLGGGQ